MAKREGRQNNVSESAGERNNRHKKGNGAIGKAWGGGQKGERQVSVLVN